MSMKNFNDTIGNRTRDLPACSAVPQQTAPPRAPDDDGFLSNFTCLATQVFWEFYTVATARYKPTFRSSAVPSSSKSSITLKRNVPRCFETPLSLYQPTRRNVPEDLRFGQLRCANLKSRIYVPCCHWPLLIAWPNLVLYS